MNESEISVAIMYTGNRADKMIEPLQQTNIDLAIEPSNPWEYDIIQLDNADRNIIYPTIRKRIPFTDTKVVYRMRGDVYEEISRWHMNPFKEWVALKILSDADGFVCVTKGMATKARRHSEIDPIGVAGLVKQPEKWPTVNHTDSELRFITLSNLDYFEKTEPIVKNAGLINEFCREHGGRWDVYGNGMHSEWLEYALLEYDYVNWGGYTEHPKGAIKEYNMMLHFSELDALPNSILEGFASNIPVITNPFYAFTESVAPIDIVHDRNHLLTTLFKYYDSPELREIAGNRGMEYLRKYHTKEVVGEQYVEFYKEMLS